MGASAPKMTRQELAVFINQEIVRWNDVVKKSGAKLD
jgi:tripartite-type tricarboxylate transporter receptor subunit TctC